MENNTITATARKSAHRAKATLKLERISILDDIAALIQVAKDNNNNKIPLNFVSSIVSETELVCPWINRDAMNYHYHTWSKRSTFNLDPHDYNLAVCQDEIAMENTIPVSSDDSSTSISNHIDILEVCKKGGQPKGTTNVNRKLLSDSILAGKNEITYLYAVEKSNAGTKMVEKNTLKIIINQVAKKRKLPKDVTINSDTIFYHVSRKSHFVTQTGVISPLACLELIIVKIVIHMERTRQCLSLMPLKRKGDAAITEKKPELLALFLKWKLGNLQRVHFVSALPGVNEVEYIDEDSDIDNDDKYVMNIEVGVLV